MNNLIFETSPLLSPLIERGRQLAEGKLDWEQRTAIVIDWLAVRRELDSQRSRLFGKLEEFEQTFSELADEARLCLLAAEVLEIRLAGWYVQLATLVTDDGWVDLSDWDRELAARAEILYGFVPDNHFEAGASLAVDLPWFLTPETWESAFDDWSPIELGSYDTYTATLGRSKVRDPVSTTPAIGGCGPGRARRRTEALQVNVSQSFDMAAAGNQGPPETPAIWLVSRDSVCQASLTIQREPAAEMSRLRVKVQFLPGMIDVATGESSTVVHGGDLITVRLFWAHGESSLLTGLARTAPNTEGHVMEVEFALEFANRRDLQLIAEATELTDNGRSSWLHIDRS